MNSVFLIPLIASPQTFQISMAGVDYILTSKWNDAPDAGWILDIADNLGNSLIAGLPFTTGADLLAELAYVGINGKLLVLTDGDTDAVPTFTNLGVNSNLYFLTDVASNG